MDNCTGPSHFICIYILLYCICGLSFGTELSFVTCGSVVKLLNVKHNVRLHSHDVRYGSGESVLILARIPFDVFRLLLRVCVRKRTSLCQVVDSSR